MGFKRIIPCLDCKNGRVVKGVNFIDIKDAGDPVEFAAIYDREGADEIVLLDLTGNAESRRIMTDIVRKVVDKVSVPVAFGGGIRSVEDFRELLEAGAKKVSVNSAAVREPQLLHSAAREFGSEKVVSAIDAKKVGDHQWNVYISGGMEDTGMDALEWAKKVEQLGAGEILLTSIDGDGTKAGYDNELNRLISENVGIPVIASGGAGKPEHFYDAIAVGKVDAVLAASLFHFREIEIPALREYLTERGIQVSPIKT